MAPSRRCLAGIRRVWASLTLLVRFLGLCPFLDVSKRLESAVGTGPVATFVPILSMIPAVIITFPPRVLL